MAGNRRILAVDDDEDVRRTIVNILSTEGYEVSEAVNGADALNVLGAYGADTVIMDILMPEKEGIETIIEINKTYPEIGILAISGGGSTENFAFLHHAKNFGADVILPKPFTPEELLLAVRQLGERLTSVGSGGEDPVKP